LTQYAFFVILLRLDATLVLTNFTGVLVSYGIGSSVLRTYLCSTVFLYTHDVYYGVVVINAALAWRMYGTVGALVANIV